ncbi:uncharacterized protein LOC143147442 [Ptiloglossa arizonensis]|uniref:uncharacterized protein LOC143147442 n=1 Tax=Ptiloglossa arizonensis TaxID=3350558 RepID=UPI003F9ED8D2
METQLPAPRDVTAPSICNPSMVIATAVVGTTPLPLPLPPPPTTTIVPGTVTDTEPGTTREKILTQPSRGSTHGENNAMRTRNKHEKEYGEFIGPQWGTQLNSGSITARQLECLNLDSQVAGNAKMLTELLP